jgi:hypothetical protein
MLAIRIRGAEWRPLQAGSKEFSVDSVPWTPRGAKFFPPAIKFLALFAAGDAVSLRDEADFSGACKRPSSTRENDRPNPRLRFCKSSHSQLRVKSETKC